MRAVSIGRTALALAAAVGLTLAGGTIAEAHGSKGGWARPLTCTGGEIASGTYASITVKGNCSIAKNAVVTVKGDIELHVCWEITPEKK